MDGPERLHGSDYLLLLGFGVLLWSFPLLNDRTLTTHETVHCQNVREMMTDGDWIIPHYGGRVWLERPPLPFWITMGAVRLIGDHPVAYRLAALLMGLPCVLLVGWMASVWFGRGMGLASGLILATMQEFTHYTTGPEADIFLCLIVTTAVALFVHLEFRQRPAVNEDLCLLGKRPWQVLAFFIVLGLANITKGLFFGDLFVLLPIAAFLLLNRDIPAIRRYIWLPGWLAFLVVGAAWPIAAYLRFPDVIDFWKADYLGRVKPGYMQEPFWYYFVHLPAVVFPWSIPALFGWWLARGPGWRNHASPERFLWCWATAPILFFSLAHGKHHHYLLQCIAPWAVLAALGAAHLWESAKETTWLQRPWLGVLCFGLPGDAALLALAWRAKVPGPEWLVPALLVAWPVAVYVGWRAAYHRDARIALGTLCALFVATYWSVYAYRTACWDLYRDDCTFIEQACATVPANKPLLVLDDDQPLNASWLLFYTEQRSTLLHNVTFLAEEHMPGPEVYLIARAKTATALNAFGTYEVLLQSAHSRYETTPEDRYALFRLQFRPGLARTPAARISPLQATGRAPGPYLVMTNSQVPNAEGMPKSQ